MGMVMDRRCDIFVIENPWSTTTYFYDPDIKLNPRYYRDHGFDYLNLYMRRARAPYLKCVYDGIDYKKTMVATDIEPMDLDDSIFQPGAMHLMAQEL
jgi:hypothetical protein